MCMCSCSCKFQSVTQSISQSVVPNRPEETRCCCSNISRWQYQLRAGRIGLQDQNKSVSWRQCYIYSLVGGRKLNVRRWMYWAYCFLCKYSKIITTVQCQNKIFHYFTRKNFKNNLKCWELTFLIKAFNFFNEEKKSIGVGLGFSEKD